MNQFALPQQEDPLALQRDLSRNEIEAMVAAMQPASRPRNIQSLEALTNSNDLPVRALERCLLAERLTSTSRRFSCFVRGIIAHARGLLDREAREIINQEEYLTAERLRDELILAVGRAQPQSRLRPWNLGDTAMLVIIDRVAADLASEGQGNGSTKYRG